MHLRLFTLKFDPLLEGFDDSELQDFLKDKELLSAREHFFIKHDTPYLLVFLSYLPGNDDLGRGGQKEREAWRELLSEEDMPLFNSLRDWRAERAKADKVPSYIVSTNRQLALIARERPLALLKPAETKATEEDRQQQMFDEQAKTADAQDNT